MSFYLLGTDLKAKTKLRDKSANSDTQWADMRHRTKIVPKVRAWKTQGLKTQKEEILFYKTPFYLY